MSNSKEPWIAGNSGLIKFQSPISLGGGRILFLLADIMFFLKYQIWVIFEISVLRFGVDPRNPQKYILLLEIILFGVLQPLFDSAYIVAAIEFVHNMQTKL